MANSSLYLTVRANKIALKQKFICPFGTLGPHHSVSSTIKPQWSTSSVTRTLPLQLLRSVSSTTRNPLVLPPIPSATRTPPPCPSHPVQIQTKLPGSLYHSKIGLTTRICWNFLRSQRWPQEIAGRSLVRPPQDHLQQFGKDRPAAEMRY